LKTSWPLLALALVTGCALSPSSSERALRTVDRAVDALGGEAALSSLKSVAIRGQDRSFEYASSYMPIDKPREAAESRFVVQRDLEKRAARVDWDRTVLRTPKPVPLKFSEIVADGVGYVAGVDSQARTQASLGANPPGHPMSGVRTAVTVRELERQSPRLLLDMKRNPGALKALPAQRVDGKELPAVQYQARGSSYVVLFDPASGLPARIRTRDADYIEGDSNYDLVLADWRPVGGVRIAHSLTYKLNERDIVAIKYDAVTPNPALGAEVFAIPVAARAMAAQSAKSAPGAYQWAIRRGHWGNFLDSDAVAWDAAEPRLVDLAPGVSLTQGSSHNSLIVEMDRYLLVFDAPIGESMSEWVIQAAKKRYNKPIAYLMLTHHHWDHANGARTYVAEGASVIVGKGNREYFTRMFGNPQTVMNDRLQRNPRPANLIEVQDKYLLSDGRREVGIYHIDSVHSTGTLIGYVRDARLGFVTDIWSPGRDPLPPKPTRALIELVQGVKRHGLDPERFAAGHGSTGSFAELARFVGQ
jgi:glyoxylase-like metal-dependent hydrolase (beta-lactamase superfamily II)